MPPRIAKLAGLGAFGAIAFFAALFAFVFYLSAHRPSGGIDWIQASVAWISLFVVFLGIVAVHVAIGRQLLYIGSGKGARGL
jgi:hypothetical protein